MLLLSGSVCAAQPATTPPPIEQRQADCARPQYASDGLVCGDAELTMLDAEVAGLALATPALAEGAIWEDQAAWFRRRGRCAFEADHRGCLAAAYADRRSVLMAAAAPSTGPLTCTGPWRGRNLAASRVAPGRPVTIRENGRLLGVATQGRGGWKPTLAWRAAGRGSALRGPDGATC
ncbi:hypothetical protein, partial [uncultured Phenylobacterium sp.]|uniref:hypothetical protein n=1 Tax=uncultured Phenylobacterium sp. TaxID=349273 RepID=UPI0025E5E7F9